MKVGTMVFLCHDINDVFMELAKMAKYTDAKTAPNVIFGLFTLSWILTRLIYFPLYVIRSVWSEPIDVSAPSVKDPSRICHKSPSHVVFLLLHCNPLVSVCLMANSSQLHGCEACAVLALQSQCPPCLFAF